MHCSDLTETRAPGPVFCLLLGVSSGTAGPITGQITSVTCPVNGQAEPELTQSTRQKRPWTAVPVMITRLTSPALLHFLSNDKFKAVLSNIRLQLPTPTPNTPQCTCTHTPQLPPSQPEPRFNINTVEALCKDHLSFVKTVSTKWDISVFWGKSSRVSAKGFPYINFPCTGIPTIKIRLLQDCLIFRM